MKIFTFQNKSEHAYLRVLILLKKLKGGTLVMAYLKQARTENDIKKLTVANVKKAYNDLARDYN